MFDKLIEIITNWWLQLTPIIIIRDYEEAVLLRFGRFKTVFNPGMHFEYLVDFLQFIIKGTVSRGECFII